MRGVRAVDGCCRTTPVVSRHGITNICGGILSRAALQFAVYVTAKSALISKSFLHRSAPISRVPLLASPISTAGTPILFANLSNAIVVTATRLAVQGSPSLNHYDRAGHSCSRSRHLARASAAAARDAFQCPIGHFDCLAESLSDGGKIDDMPRTVSKAIRPGRYRLAHGPSRSRQLVREESDCERLCTKDRLPPSIRSLQLCAQAPLVPA